MRRGALLSCLLGLLVQAGGAGAAPPAPDGGQAVCLAGVYDGHATEIAAGLDLGKDGRFRYALSYGALDEHAEGAWRADADAVYLTADASTPPAFVLVSDRAGPGKALHLRLETPEGLPPQIFDAEVTFADGQRIQSGMRPEGLVFPLNSIATPVAVTLALPAFGLVSRPFPLAGARGRRIVVRFDANDLGTARLAGERLSRNGSVLEMERYGRLLRFRPAAGQDAACPAPPR